MALQVWLPLTKDLRNQGLASSANFGDTTVFATTGKLGAKSLYSNAQKTAIFTELTNVINFSFAYWIKVDSSITVSSWADIIGLECIVGNDTTIIRDEFTATAGQHQILMGKDSTVGSNSYTYYGVGNTNTGAKDIWTHYVIIKNNTNTYVYTNGILTNTLTNTNFEKTPQKLTGKIYLGNTSSTAAQIQDLRIYDHCLSPMEVKQLSQGLVLHYPLNRNGWGIDNLMPNSINMPLGSANPTTGTWRLAGSSQMERSRVAISDAPISNSAYGFQSVGLQTGPDASCWGIDGFPRKNGTTYTISAWGRIVGGSSTAAMLGFSIYSATTLDYGGTYGKAKSVDSEYYGSGGYDYFGGRLNPNGNWTRIYRTFTSNSTSDNIYVGFNTAKTGSSVTVQVCGIKLEEGDKMTTWTPHINEDMYNIMGLNGTTEYDCSGYCNNGTRTGTFSWTSDTPKYAVSTTFSGSQYILADSPSSEGTTLALWAKTTSTSNAAIAVDYKSKLGFGFYGGVIIPSCNSVIKTTYPTTNYNVNQWNHIVVVRNSSSSIQLYINGTLQTAASKQDYWSGGVIDGLSIAARPNGSSPIACQVSDFRVYATALSADDVKSLYQNCATIDPDGTIHGQIRS